MNKRLILITIDCLRADRLKVYGFNKDIIPNLNKFSKNGFIFENAITNASNTAPSFYSLFTSELPSIKTPYAPLPPNKETIYKILKKNAIKTCGIHSNPHLGTYSNYNIGFDDFYDIYSERQYYSVRKKIFKIIYKLFDLIGFGNYVISLKRRLLNFLKIKNKVPSLKTSKTNAPYADAKSIIIEAIKWLKKNYDKDFFLWIHFMDAHRPNFPPNKNINKVSNEKITDGKKIFLHNIINIIKKNPEITKKIDEKDKQLTEILYNAELNYIDHYLGIFFSYLKQMKIYNNTNIILTADHGEALFEHNSLGHQANLYDELIRIPLIIKLANSENENERIKNLVQIIDIAPTILNLYNLPSNSAFKGNSLIPLIQKKNNGNFPGFVISTILHNNLDVLTTYTRNKYEFYILVSIRSLKWKLIYDDQTKEFQLFDLKNDPKELYNLFETKNDNIITIKKKYLEELQKILIDYNIEEQKINRNIRILISKFIDKI